MSKIVKQYKDAKRTKLKDFCLLGFELETQRTNGMTFNNRLDEETVSGRMWDYAYEQFEQIDNCITDIYYHCRSFMFHSVKSLTVDQFRKAVEALQLESVTIEALLDSKLIFKPEYDLLRIRDQVTESIYENLNSADFQDDDEQTDFMLPDNIEAVEDASVTGFEFRTIGGLTLDEFKEACKAVYKLDHEIDTGCSFHIHLSIKDVKHSYGGRLQAAMIEYLLMNIHRVPRDVRDRWQKSETYFRPRISRDKYTFVHKHAQDTWEFRCFGNVKSVQDAIKCAHLAMEALQHGYKIMAFEEVLLKDVYDLTDDDFYRMCCEALVKSKNLSSVLSHRNAAVAA